MKVNIFLRNPHRLGNFSLEIFYKELYTELDKKIDAKLIRVPYKNKGLIGRLLNIVFCYMNQTDVNHIVGDITYCALLMDKKKLVITLLDCISLHKNTGFKKYILQKYLFEMPIKKSSKRILISKATKIDLEKLLKIKLNNYSIIPVTVSKAFFSQEEMSKPKKMSNTFLMIGTAENKNIERVAEAVEKINCLLKVIGKLNQSQKQQLKKYKINFIEVDKPLSEKEMIEEYQNADLLLFPSTLEGFGMPILEANLSGLCIITSNISSMPYVANNSALLVDPYNVESIRKGVKRISNDSKLRDELVINGKINSTRFKIENISREHINIYNSI